MPVSVTNNKALPKTCASASIQVFVFVIEHKKLSVSITLVSKSVPGLCRSFWRAGAATEGLVEKVVDKLLEILSAGKTSTWLQSTSADSSVPSSRPAQTRQSGRHGCLLHISEQLHKYTYIRC